MELPENYSSIMSQPADRLDRLVSDPRLNLTATVWTTTKPGPQSFWDHRQVARMLWVFGGPFIFFAGLGGNTLIVAVMTRRRMQGSSTCVYLTLMAIADTMVLLTGMIPEWLEAARIVVLKELHQAACKLEKFLFYTSADTAVWFLVIFTIDRFIAVCYPLKKNKFCRSSRAKLSCAVVFGAAILKNVHVLFTRGAQYKVQGNRTSSTLLLISNCGKPSAACEYFEDFVRPWIAFVVVSLLPFCLILLCNVCIIRALLSVRRLRAEHSIVSTSDKSLIQMTAMCLSASFCFLVCITPSILLLIGKPYWKNAPFYEIAKVINNELVYVNHSINFFLYCVTGKRFRSGITAVCRCRRKSRVDTTMTDTSIESRTTVVKWVPSPVQNQRRFTKGHDTGTLVSGRHIVNRSVSMGMANVVVGRKSSEMNIRMAVAAAAAGSAGSMKRSRSLQLNESCV